MKKDNSDDQGTGLAESLVNTINDLWIVMRRFITVFLNEECKYEKVRFL